MNITLTQLSWAYLIPHIASNNREILLNMLEPEPITEHAFYKMKYYLFSEYKLKIHRVEDVHLLMEKKTVFHHWLSK